MAIRWSACFVFAVVFALGSPAAAQTSSDELARRHFESGAAYLQESDYENALRAFEKSYELSKRPEILLNIATVHERRNDLQAAVDALQKYLAEKPDAEDAATVQLRIANLKKRIDETAKAAPTPEPAPGPAPTPAPPPPAPTEPAQPNRVPAYILLTVGGVAAAGALLTGIFAKTEYDDANASCGQTKTCADDDLSTGRTMAITSTVLTGVAIVGVGLGITLLLTAKPQRETPALATTPRIALGVGPGGASASARFTF